MNSPVCTVRSPKECSPEELREFVDLVRAGGEVAYTGLADRVQKAHSLAYLKDDETLIGIAGLKFPSQNHRSEVANGAQVYLHEHALPLELGWVYVLPSERGGKSYLLCEALISNAKGAGVFATSREGNKAMHCTLGKLGFNRQGSDWPSGQNPENLWLFIKNTA